MSIKLKFRASLDVNKEGSLYYQVIHERVARQIKSGYHIFANEWDAEYERINDSIQFNYAERERLKLIQSKVDWDIRKLNAIVNSFENDAVAYTVDDVVHKYRHSNDECVSVFDYTHRQVEHLKRLNRIRTAETYQSTLNSFMRFRENNDLSFDRVGHSLIELYEAYLKARNVRRNTSSFYMRILRTLYNQAVEDGLTEQKTPFRHVYTGIDKTVKRAVPIKYIKAIKELNLALEPKLDFARDIFLFSFYTRGMSFIDIAHLKKSDLRYGILSYVRKKTGQRLCILWEKPMRQLADKYHDNSSDYFFPIIQSTDKDEREQCKLKSKQIGRSLKKIATRIDLQIPLTLYTARHSWASIAREKRVPIDVIRDGLGHDSEKTTRIYLASIDSSSVDRANHKIMCSL